MVKLITITFSDKLDPKVKADMLVHVVIISMNVQHGLPALSLLEQWECDGVLQHSNNKTKI